MRDVSVEGAAADIQRCTERSERVRTYRTVLSCAPAARDGPASGLFLADVVRPDRLYVRQKIGDDCDAWITIGDATWNTLILELAGPQVIPQLAPACSAVNGRLLLDRFVGVMRDKLPNRLRICRYRGVRFTHLEYDPIDADTTQHFLWKVEGSEIDRDKATWMHVWLRRDCLLAKVQVFVREGGELFEYAHMFAMYDYPIEIGEPR